MRFLELNLVDAVPDANTNWTFREARRLNRGHWSVPRVPAARSVQHLRHVLLFNFRQGQRSLTGSQSTDGLATCGADQVERAKAGTFVAPANLEITWEQGVNNWGFFIGLHKGVGRSMPGVHCRGRFL